jgi:acyl-CoA thioester hydrolase
MNWGQRLAAGRAFRPTDLGLSAAIQTQQTHHMDSVSGTGGRNLQQEHEIQFRVRYKETDAQGRVHHANYFTYFEMGRVEMLRAAGYDYRELEAQGVLLVVNKISCHFRVPAAYDDLLRLRTRIERITPARVEQTYRLFRDDILLATAESVLACVDRSGTVRRMPDWLVIDG